MELDPSQSPLAFKQRVCELTGVPVERQKLMGKGQSGVEYIVQGASVCMFALPCSVVAQQLRQQILKKSFNKGQAVRRKEFTTRTHNKQQTSYRAVEADAQGR